MEQTLRQLEELLLGAVPTVILLALLTALYTRIVHRPLLRMLAERRARTEGAMAQARVDIAAAEARTSDYEQRLREARQKTFKNLESRRQLAVQARSEVVAQARGRAQDQVKQARASLDQDKQQAARTLQEAAAKLAGEIVRRVLRPPEAPTQVGGR